MCRGISKGLRDAGNDVIVSCIDFTVPRNTKYEMRQLRQDGFTVFAIRPYERLPGFVMPLWRMRPDREMTAIAQHIISTECPDLVYVNGGWEIGEFVFAAKKSEIPVVFHVHCFAHMCAQQFLMNGKRRICSGPETQDKCFHCLQEGHKVIRCMLEMLCSGDLGKSVARLIFGRKKASSFLLREALSEAFAFSRRLRDSVDAFVVTSDLIAGIHEKYGIHRKRMHVLPHFLPLGRLHRSSRQVRSGKNRLRIGFFGRMTPEKGFEILLDVLCKLETTFPSMFDLWVISREADKASLLAKLGKSGIEPSRLQVFNDLTGTDLNPVLANLDVCIIPSLCYEIGPLTMLEAMAQGVPCIVSDSVGMSSLIQDGRNGRLFNTGNAEALENVLVDLLKHPDAAEKWRHCLPNISDEQNYMTSLTNILQSVLSLQTATGGL